MSLTATLAMIRFLVAHARQRLDREEGIATTEMAVLVGALVILAATAAAVIAAKVMGKVNGMNL